MDRDIIITSRKAQGKCVVCNKFLEKGKGVEVEYNTKKGPIMVRVCKRHQKG